MATTQSQTAKQFSEFWLGKGDEKQETSRFWIQLLGEVLGIQETTSYIEFEKRVKLAHTSYIDAYIPKTKVLIEQKSSDVDIHKEYQQSDGKMLTPFQQAKRYADEMKNSERPRWIVVCNFQEFLVYDLEFPHDEPQQIFLKDLEKEIYQLQFLVDENAQRLTREEEISLKAGELVGKLYDAFLKEYINPEAKSLLSLNILCVRIVFCFYAEKAGLFDKRTSFEDYIKSFNLADLRKGIIDLFNALNTKEQDRDKYDIKLKPFPYADGGLFVAEDVEIPNFTQEIVDVLINHCAVFDWSEISPTIFGAVFESTIDPTTRSEGGMHYTSIANIHKIIDPLFMDEFTEEYNDIINEKCSVNAKKQKLFAFQQKLSRLKFLDPACGSGNFLTETYLSLRRLENKIIAFINDGERTIGYDEFIMVKINQFYGIEINDFAVTVAKTALWIAESQMTIETEKILGQNISFLPLKSNSNIIEGNALKINWKTLKPEDTSIYSLPNTLFFGAVDDKSPKKHYDYIIGNPPFIGYKDKNQSQKEDLEFVCKNKSGESIKNIGSLDYVCGWYFQAAKLIADNKKLKAALVSTNSITQGEQVTLLWKPLFENYNISIDFAYKPFVWSNEIKNGAKVHCIIVGFSHKNPDKQCKIFSDKNVEICRHINAYLYNAPDIWITSRRKPLSPVKEITLGVHIFDNHHFIFSEQEKDEFIKQEPASQKYFKKWVSASDFLYGKCRYYLDLENCPPNKLKKMPLCYNRVKLVMEYRRNNPASKNTSLEKEPYKPKQGWKANCPYIIIPNTSSENRTYLPIDFKDSDTIVTMPDLALPHGDLYDFAILSSKVHIAWVKIVCGRQKSDLRYANGLVYNNFPWPNPTEKQKVKIEKAAQKILDIRAIYTEASLAALYDDVVMPSDLRRAHRDNDIAVLEAYGFDKKITEDEIVAKLFELYQELTKK